MDENKKNEMNKGLLQEHTVKRDRSLTATGVVIAVIAVLLIFAYYQINRTLRQRSLDRLAEGAEDRDRPGALQGRSVYHSGRADRGARPDRGGRDLR